tara:strand:+ start:205 stop:468 length:264 start_codon:yes stop_codon:yes gene_type:complete
MPNKVTLESLKAALDKTLAKGMNDYLNAPARRGYSKIAGEQIASKNDVARATNQNCRYINEMARELFGVSIFKDPDEEVVTIGTKED